MPSQARSLSDNTLIHSNSYQAEDFHTAEVVTGAITRTLPEGEMRMRQWYFEGIRIAYNEIQLQKPAAIAWENDLEVIQLQLNLGGKTEMADNAFGQPLVFEKLQHNIFYYKGFRGKLIYEEFQNRSFMIQFSKKAFLEIASGLSPAMQSFITKIENGQATLYSPQPAFISLPLQSAATAILDCQLEGGLLKMFLKAKCLEILSLQISLLEAGEAQPMRYCKTEYDRERIQFARDYLIQHSDLPPSLPELARIAGINEFKLKNGFKELFGQTVFAYLMDYRMTLAQTFMEEGTLSISEIAYELGYSSLQHFSTVFRKKFGFPPSEFRRG